jgi:hypothetical protein
VTVVLIVVACLVVLAAAGYGLVRLFRGSKE